MIKEYTCLHHLLLKLFIRIALELRSFLLATIIGINIQEISKTSTTKNIALNKRSIA